MVWEGLERLLFAQGLCLDVSWALLGMPWLSNMLLERFRGLWEAFWKDLGEILGELLGFQL